MKKVLRFLAYFGTVVISIIFLLLISTQTPAFKTLLTKIVVTQVNNNLNGTLTIQSLEGNLFSRLVINEISLSDGEQEILHIGSIEINYHLLSLLKNTIDLRSVIINGLSAKVFKKAEGWNWEQILINNDEENQPEDKKLNTPKIVLQHLELTRGDVALNYDEAKGNFEVKDLEIQLSLLYGYNTLKANLKNLSSQITLNNEHSIEIKGIEGAYYDDGMTKRVDALKAETNNLILGANAVFSNELARLEYKLSCDLKSTADLAYFVPSIHPDKSFKLESELVSDDKNLTLKANLFSGKGSMELHASSNNFLSSNSSPLQNYEASLKFDRLEPLSFLKEPPVDLILNGTISTSENSFHFSKPVVINIDLSNTTINGNLFSNPIALEKGVVNAKLSGDGLDCAIQLECKDNFSYVGNVYLANLDDLEDLSASGEIRHLDIGALSPLKGESSDINFDFNLQAKSITEFTKLTVDALPSTLFGHDLQEMEADLSMEGKDISVNKFKLRYADNSVDLFGSYSEAGESDLSFSLELNNISPILESFVSDFDPISTSGYVTGRLHGKEDNLNVTAQISLNESKYQDANLKRLFSTLSFTLNKNIPIVANVNMVADSLTYANIDIEKVELNGTYAENIADIGLFIKQSQARTLSLDTKASIADIINISPIDLKIQYDQMSFSSDSGSIAIDNGKIAVDNFALKSDEQRINIDGYYSDKEADISLSLQQIDLSILDHFIENYPINNAILDLSLQVTGDINKPRIDTNLTLSDVEIGELRDLNAELKLSYNPELGLLESQLSSQIKTQEFLNTKLTLPLEISMGNGIVFNKYNPLTIDLSLKDIDLSVLSPFIQEVTDISGTLNAEFHSSGSLSELSPIGQVVIKNGKIKIPELGTKYDDINMLLKAEENAIFLSDLSLKSGQGKMKLSGELVHNKTIDLDKMPSLSLEMRANDFPIMNSEAIEIFIDSDLKINNKPSNPLAKGEIKINHGRINIDKLLKNSSQDRLLEKPLLVTAQESYQLDDSETALSTPLLLKIPKLSGELSLLFPKNFWIRGSDMNIELGGSLDVLINDTKVQLFGTIATLRGYYIFYGKRFDITHGEITFSGGELLAPNLQIETIYTFRDTNNKKNVLNLIISGGLDDVNISFLLNGKQIEEGDAISYLLFGRSFDELNQKEQGHVTSQTSVISNYFANKLAESVSSLVGEKFQLDLIKFSSDTSKSQIGIEVGKYLTDNLFVSYKRDFRYSDTNEPMYEEILVEYEIMKNVYLQALKSDSKSTGLDLIWRLRWK